MLVIDMWVVNDFVDKLKYLFVGLLMICIFEKINVCLVIIGLGGKY